MFSGDVVPVAPEPGRQREKIPFRNGAPSEFETASPAEPEGVPPRELTPDLPPCPDNRQRVTNQGPAYQGGAPGRRLGAFAVGASGRVPRQPTKSPSPGSRTGR